MTFERKYAEEFTEKRDRDRFQVEFNKEERDLFIDAQVFIMQSKDATAIKQLAYLGWFAISTQEKFFDYLRQVLFKNTLNNKRMGIDVRTEIESKFQYKNLKKGGNWQPGGKLSER